MVHEHGHTMALVASRTTTSAARWVSHSIASCPPPQCRACPALAVAMAVQRESQCEAFRAPSRPRRRLAPPRPAPVAGGLPQPPPPVAVAP